MYYILNEDKTIIPVDIQEYTEWCRVNPNAFIVEQTVLDNTMISTVFLGLDHGMNTGIPLVFETMVFRYEQGGEQERYSTYDEAIAGHHEWCKRIFTEI